MRRNVDSVILMTHSKIAGFGMSLLLHHQYVIISLSILTCKSGYSVNLIFSAYAEGFSMGSCRKRKLRRIEDRERCYNRAAGEPFYSKSDRTARPHLFPGFRVLPDKQRKQYRQLCSRSLLHRQRCAPQ